MQRVGSPPNPSLALTPPAPDARPHAPTGQAGGCPFLAARDNKDVSGLLQLADQVMNDKTFAGDSARQAVNVLVGALSLSPADPKGEINAALGRAYFMMEAYGDAAKHLQVAAKRAPGDADVADLLKRANQNLAIDVKKPTMPEQRFDATALALPPAMHLRAPTGVKPMPRSPQSLGATLGRTAKNIAGAVLGAGIEGAIKVAGAFGTDDGKNTVWYKRPGLAGTLTLGAARHWLNESTLQSSYDGALVGHQPPGQKRPEWTERFRTATGAWTTSDPMEGAAGTEFQRQGLDGVNERVNRATDPSLPNVREVSRAFLASNGEQVKAPFLNNLTMAWIQFMVHDWVSHGQNLAKDTYKIDLAADDPFRKKYGKSFLEIPKTQPNPTRKDGRDIYLNEVTHWWDASQVYGSDQAKQDALRTGPDGKLLPGGKLRLDENGNLPIDPETGVEETGFSRNWWVGLGVFHTLFARNHNAICDKLQASGECEGWSSDQLFNVTRMINAAMMAKIHTVEWTPAVLPNQKLVQGMGANWWGLAETMLKPFGERKTNNRLDVSHPILGGLVGGKRDNHGKPYGFSEEFVEVYRLHAGLPNELELRKIGSEEVEKVETNSTRAVATKKLSDEFGMANLINSFGYQKMAALVNNNYPKFMTEMSVEGLPLVDLGAIDILRARERGVPQYNEFRRQLGLPPIHEFEDLGASPEVTKKLKEVYGDEPEDVEKLDLLVGTSTEALRPEHFGFGETLFQVFIQMASRRLEADPFYTDKFKPEYYTKTGIELIDQCTMKGLFLEHYPELAKSGLAGVNNAFEPWGTTAATHPEEHPLTAHGEKY